VPVTDIFCCCLDVNHTPCRPPTHTHTQDDVLLPTTTPREALAFTAALRLPGRSAAARQQRAAAVQGMLAGMALTHCADTLVSPTSG
jgi:ABC-type multidrug transport system ATPase subunit